MKGVCQNCGLENQDVEVKEMTKSQRIRVPNSDEVFELESRKVEGWECKHCGEIHDVKVLDSNQKIV